MIAHTSTRAAYLTVVIGTIGLGLWVHRDSAAFSAVTRDVLGDAIWAAMMMWCVAVIAPAISLSARGALAYGIGVAVEFSQLVHTPAIDAARSTTLGSLVLGSGFDPRDLAAYAVGIAVAVFLEWAALRSARALRS